MPRKCSATHCHTLAGDSDVSIFRFPLKDKKLLRQWVRNINHKQGKNGKWVPDSNSRLCSKHFADNCLIKCRMLQRTPPKPNARLLREGSVPTIFWGAEGPPLSPRPIQVKFLDGLNIIVLDGPPPQNATTVGMAAAGDSTSVARRGVIQDHGDLCLKASTSTTQQRVPSSGEDNLLRHWLQNIKFTQNGLILPNIEPTIFSGDEVPTSTTNVELSDGIDIILSEDEEPISYDDTFEEMDAAEYFLYVARRGVTHDHGHMWLLDPPTAFELKLKEEKIEHRKRMKMVQQKNRRWRKRESTMRNAITELKKEALDKSPRGSSDVRSVKEIKVSKKLLIRKRIQKKLMQGMLLHFCPQCGTKLQTGFRFCPSCGEKLPGPVGLPAPAPSSPGPIETTSSDFSQLEVTDAVTSLTTTANSDHLRQDESPRSVLSPRKRRVVTSQVDPIREEEVTETTVSSPVARTTAATVSSPTPRSPGSAKGKAKKAKRVSAIEPLQEGEELSDTTGRKWCLLKILEQSEVELTYAVQQRGPGSLSSTYKHVLKLGAKDGRIFNEQNFFQRAAKPSSVDKWMKHSKTDFLGLPYCVGFGLHAEAYRFLIFPNMGQPLQSLMVEEELLPEAAVLQLACRILDVLEFIHDNEYVHADIQAKNIYIHPTGDTQVYLAGYCHAFRYCPGGRHVEYREDSRTPHEGDVEFISLESHKGAGPSRRSDLQALGYCLLRWHAGVLPWSSLTHTPSRVAAEKQRFMEDVPGLLSLCYGQKTVSRALQSYLSQVMALQYSEQPDYRALREGLHAALTLLGGSLDQPLSLLNTTRRR